MAARYCSWCDFNWPADVHECPTCGQPTAYAGMEKPDEGWQDRLRAAIASQAPPQPFRVVRGELTEADGGLLLSTHDVVRSDILDRLKTDEIVRVECGDEATYVEVLGYSYEGRVYAVRRFTFPPPDFAPKAWFRKRRKRKT